MHALVSEYVEHDSSESRERIRSHFRSEIEEFIYLSSKLQALLFSYHEKNPRSDGTNPRQSALGLMMRGATTLMAAFELTITGYIGEPEILVRSALERFCVAWDIVTNPDRYLAWRTKGGKFDSTSSISRAKVDFPLVGKMYGHLSNMHVHITPLNSSPSMFMEDGNPKFQFYGYLPTGKEDLSRAQIYGLLLDAYILLQLAEVVYFNYAVEPETIRIVPGENHVQPVVSRRHKRFADAAIAHFRLMSTDPLKTLE